MQYLRCLELCLRASCVGVHRPFVVELCGASFYPAAWRRRAGLGTDCWNCFLASGELFCARIEHRSLSVIFFRRKVGLAVFGGARLSATLHVAKKSSPCFFVHTISGVVFIKYDRRSKTPQPVLVVCTISRIVIAGPRNCAKASSHTHGGNPPTSNVLLVIV